MGQFAEIVLDIADVLLDGVVEFGQVGVVVGHLFRRSDEVGGEGARALQGVDEGGEQLSCRSPSQRRQARSVSPGTAAERLVGQGMLGGNGAALIVTASEGAPVP